MYLLTGVANNRYLKNRSFSNKRKALRTLHRLSKHLRSKGLDIVVEGPHQNIIAQYWRG
jgi:uncharacterized protein (DUF302 family)